jgi:hypothetical protein
MIIPLLWLYWPCDHTGPMIIPVLWSYRFYDYTGPIIIPLLWLYWPCDHTGPMIIPVLWLYWSCDHTGSMIILVLWSYCSRYTKFYHCYASFRSARKHISIKFLQLFSTYPPRFTLFKSIVCKHPLFNAIFHVLLQPNTTLLHAQTHQLF